VVASSASVLPAGVDGGKDDAPVVGGHLALDQAAPLEPADGVW